MSAAPQKFSVSHLEGSEFRSDGLRPFFEYRDLGIRAATNDGVVAHVIRAVPGVPARPGSEQRRPEHSRRALPAPAKPFRCGDNF